MPKLSNILYFFQNYSLMSDSLQKFCKSFSQKFVLFLKIFIKFNENWLKISCFRKNFQILKNNFYCPLNVPSLVESLATALARASQKLTLRKLIKFYFKGQNNTYVV